MVSSQLQAAPELQLHLLSADMPAIADAAKISSEALALNLDSLVKGLVLLRAEYRASVAEQAARGVDAASPLAIRVERLRTYEVEASRAIELLQVSR